MSAVRRARNRTIRHTADIIVFAVNIDGLPATHPLFAAKTVTSLRGNPDFEPRRIQSSDVADHLAQGTHICFYMIHADVIICRIALYVTKTAAHITDVDCYTTKPRLQPRAYILIHQVAQLLERIGTQMVNLTLLDTDRRIYGFYSELGFVAAGRGFMKATVADILAATERLFR